MAVAACSSDAGVTQQAVRPTGTEAPEPTEATEPEPATTTTTTEAPASTGPTTTEAPVFEPAPIEWQEFSPGVEVGTIEVPVDYDDLDGPAFELFVARHNATDPDNRIGTLLVNRGGPGFGSTDFAIFADQIYDEELLEKFDIVGWDPRGTGQSAPAIDCITDYDQFFATPDITPDDDAEREQGVAVAAEFAGECERNNAEIIQHVGTNDAARDIDVIRRALGEDQVSFFGFSYGSELGGTWATMFPDTVRAAVLDGAADPNADRTEWSVQQTAGFESTLTTFLAQCSADASCVFHNDGNAEGAFDALMASLDATPIPSVPGRPDVNRGVATSAVVQAMYSETYWPALEQALADAQRGDGSGLLALYDSYYQRNPDGTYGNELEAFQTITCADSAERLSVEEEDANAALLTAVAPRLAPAGLGGNYMCTFFPESLDPRIHITGDGAGPIVVVGTTGDAATPLDSTRKMVEALDEAVLVVVDADQHTGYNANQCINEVVSRYLVDLQVPANETTC